MLWILLLLILFIPAWMLLTPVVLKTDTRIPEIMVQWRGIAKATVIYENEEWWLKIRVLFFSKKWNLVQLMLAAGNKKKRLAKSGRKKDRKKRMSFLKLSKILRTFEIIEWEVAIDADDITKNACFYWLNFFPLTRQHIHINFMDENYLVLVIRNKVWRLVYAFIK